ncbi:hypothetical protein CHU98_g6884 [Xylaria longipes]|nr:hypothetical protein CHU98_g6884 [Xylaria longipes]
MIGHMDAFSFNVLGNRQLLNRASLNSTGERCQDAGAATNTVSQAPSYAPILLIGSFEPPFLPGSLSDLQYAGANT